MNTLTTPPPKDDIATQMLKVARNLAMDIYPLDKILDMHEVDVEDFHRWKSHPQFLAYLRAEKEAWGAATNAAERTKLKASIVMEDFMETAYTELHSKTNGLNHRVELGKLIAKIAGMGEPKVLSGSGEGGFRLQINIGSTSVTVAPQSVQKTINHNEDDIKRLQIEEDLNIAPDYEQGGVEIIDEDGHNLLDDLDTLNY